MVEANKLRTRLRPSMLRRTFLSTALAALACPILRASGPRDEWVGDPGAGPKLAAAATKQVGVTTGYAPNYSRIPYPNGDVPRQTGVCADVIVRAGRDALGLDLQRLVHEDMQRDFAAYPRIWGLSHPDANIDHRRVLNLEVYWRRSGAQRWAAPLHDHTNGAGFPGELLPGDILTWLLDDRLPHVGMVVSHGPLGSRIVHNIGSGVEEVSLVQMRSQRAKGHFRWPVA
jgi:uncharacterized protein YijF (DUF1287 family)